MPERKIAEAPKPCFDTGHNPAGHIVRSPGKYEHVCPSCGKKIAFTVPLVTW